MPKIIFFVFVLITIVEYGLPKHVHPKVEIVGGNDTDIRLHPWMVSLRWEGDHVCGGFLIADKWVVTAAHCTDLYTRQVLTVRVGSTYRSTGGEEYNISQIIPHPESVHYIEDYDIALIELTEAVNNPNASAVALPTQEETLTPGTNLTVTGWGYTSETSGGVAEVLQEVVIPIVSLEDCAKAYHADAFSENVLCAGYLGIGGKDACSEDSGGPGVTEGKVFGIVSRGIGCAEPEFPGIYTNVAKFVSWIQNTTGI